MKEKLKILYELIASAGKDEELKNEIIRLVSRELIDWETIEKNVEIDVYQDPFEYTHVPLDTVEKVRILLEEGV